MRRSELLVAMMLGLFGCAPGDIVTRDYRVAVQDSVLDRYDVVETALCAGELPFTGNVDVTCPARPMIRSFEMTVGLDCTYVDHGGTPRSYSAPIYFPAGYIHEPRCGEVAPRDAGMGDR